MAPSVLRGRTKGVCVMSGRPGHRCTGASQWHHPVKQQRIRDRFPYGAWRGDDGRWHPAPRSDPVTRSTADGRSLNRIIEDPRNRIWACWHAHQVIEGDVKDLPACVWEFAREFGLDAGLEGDIRRQEPVPRDLAARMGRG